jgi:hypothetical protein
MPCTPEGATGIKKRWSISAIVKAKGSAFKKLSEIVIRYRMTVSKKDSGTNQKMNK